MAAMVEGDDESFVLVQRTLNFVKLTKNYSRNYSRNLISSQIEGA
jgi:hypothetical protein